MSGSTDKRWLNVPMTPEEKDALFAAAAKYKRTPRQQAAVYIRAGLESDGLLAVESVARDAIAKVKGEQSCPSE